MSDRRGETRTQHLVPGIKSELELFFFHRCFKLEFSSRVVPFPLACAQSRCVPRDAPRPTLPFLGDDPAVYVCLWLTMVARPGSTTNAPTFRGMASNTSPRGIVDRTSGSACTLRALGTGGWSPHGTVTVSYCTDSVLLFFIS